LFLCFGVVVVVVVMGAKGFGWIKIGAGDEVWIKKTVSKTLVQRF